MLGSKLGEFLKIARAQSVFLKIVLSGCFFLSWGATQASYERTTAVGAKKPSSYLSVFSYSLSSDAFDSNDQKVINQGARYTGTYLFFKRKLYTSFSLGASFHSVDSALQEDDNGSFHLTDLSLALGTSAINLYKKKQHSVNLFTALSNVFPVSERSRNEGYKSVPALRSDLAYRVGKVDFVASGQYAHVVNSFDADLLGNSNLESSMMGGVSARINFEHLRIQYSYRLGVLNYLNGESFGSSGNNFSVTGIFNRSIWASVSLSNLSYVEEQFVDLWFFDPFARIYRLSMGVNF